LDLKAQGLRQSLGKKKEYFLLVFVLIIENRLIENTNQTFPLAGNLR